ncbi:uncharacterized protein EDB91DRAFT_1087888 [Suillus paluster]|uniref:uncharacterized protein n=1 Tax=Suillus paluster TaxID=48578 RepID=UPI001B87FA78|nr:uncharacterized protein EDB91DRAFT_1087888 [Suillus paluster]KAG1723178.1 hypothetical protein EDB91DRAFT_1087888 [Suillus paluster]
MPFLQAQLARVRGPFGKKLPISSVTRDHLERLGVTQGSLDFYEGAIVRLASTGPPDQLEALAGRLAQILNNISMDNERGARVLMDEMLRSAVHTAAQPFLATVIVPDMKLAIDTGEGITIHHPETGYQLSITGHIDYTLVGCLPENRAADNLAHYLPEAVAQALTLITYSGTDKVYFCLTTGLTWIFVILVKNGTGNFVYYHSQPRVIDWRLLSSRSYGPNTLRSLDQVMKLIQEWLTPSNGSFDLLFQLAPSVDE